MKRVLILGASSDIGLELTKQFLKKKYFVIAHYNKNGSELKKIKSQNLHHFKFDLLKIKQFENFVKKNKIFNKIDIFVSLSGYLKIKKISQVKIDDFLEHINVNYLSNFIITKKIISNMKRNNWGRVLYASSIGTKFGGSDNSFVYSLSKFMNEFFPKPIKKLTKNNILFNTLKIGLTKTKLNKIDRNKNLTKRVKLIPLGRMATIREVVNYILFLSTDENTLISNEVINISGGE